MAFDLGTLIRAAALGGGAYQQAQRDQEDRTRQQQQEDAETERRKAADARAAAAEQRDKDEWILRQEGIRLDNERRRQTPAPEIPKPYRMNFRGVTNDYGSMDELLKDQARLAASMPDPDAPRDTRLPHEIEMDELRRRELEARASGAERDNEVEAAPQRDNTIEEAVRLRGSLGDMFLDPADGAAMSEVIRRNALIRSLINDSGLTTAEAEREARRRLGS